MTQLYLHPYRPEVGDRRVMKKVARNFRATYRQYQSVAEIQKDSAEGRWVAIESAMPGRSISYDVMGWRELFGERWAVQQGIHFVTGSMNHGLPIEILDMMDFHVHIPQFDDVDYFAPASAAAIILQDVFMRVSNRAGVFG